MRIILVFSLLIGSLLSESVEGIGYGLTKDAAIEQAKRDAVEVGLGAYISSETVVTATTLTDNIYSKAQGFVKTFKVANYRALDRCAPQNRAPNLSYRMINCLHICGVIFPSWEVDFRAISVDVQHHEWSLFGSRSHLLQSLHLMYR